jgi:hypothetical protein
MGTALVESYLLLTTYLPLTTYYLLTYLLTLVESPLRVV